MSEEEQKKTCRTCEKTFPATKEYFHVAPTNKDGLNTECHQCKSDAAKKRWRDRHPKPEIEPIPNGFRRCTGCQQVFPATLDFFQMKHRGKFHPRCKACKNAEDAIHAQKRYEEHPPVYSSEESKQCSACERELPATPEYFSRRKRVKSGLMATCKDCEKVRHQQANLLHAEKIRGQKAEYREKNRETLRAKGREYAKTHPLIRRANYYRYQNRKKSIPGTLTSQEIQEKLTLQKYCCYYCKKKFQRKPDKTFIYQIEHTVPISREEAQPRHDINHVVLSCPTCNLKKGDKLPHEWPEGNRLL